MAEIQSTSFFEFDPSRVPSPCFVVDEVVVEQNLKVLQQIQQTSGAKVLIALKAFSMFSLAPLINQYLSGSCASGVNEARLAYEHFGGNAIGADKREVHVYNPAFRGSEIDELIDVSDHIVLNSAAQWQQHKDKLLQAKNSKGHLEIGLRINPMLSTGETEIYDPCAAGSRLGINIDNFKQHFPSKESLAGITGLHFHTLCEQGFDALEKTLQAVEQQFADFLYDMQWLNFGGGHHITKPDYNRQGLIQAIQRIQDKYQLQVYLEPGEAVVLRSGVLVSEVLDITNNEMDVAILDSSATCHMPDTLEMPYRADIFLSNQSSTIKECAAGLSREKQYSYRLGGQTCLAGDVMGDYSFDEPLTVGQRLMFDDMAHYTMVKTTTFNGMGLPSLAVWNSNTDELRIVKQFSYEDFLNRLS